jgi:pSer/pThr/pTyr-binding forkhead associated (FHA) protein
VERIWARLVIHLGDGGDRVVHLHEGHIDVGRAADASIRLTLPEVSAHHAELQWDGTQLRMRDLSSTNGTEVNGRRVSTPTSCLLSQSRQRCPASPRTVATRGSGG